MSIYLWLMELHILPGWLLAKNDKRCEYLSMTKVLMNMDLLAYQEEIRDALRQVLGQNTITGVPQPFRAETVLAQEHVLPPPCIGFITLDGYLGQGDDYIGFTASHDFGIYSMRITIVDDQGNLIESGEAWPMEDPNIWEYLPQACVPPGTTVTVQVTAMDCMGSIGTCQIVRTMGGGGGMVIHCTSTCMQVQVHTTPVGRCRGVSGRSATI